MSASTPVAVASELLAEWTKATSEAKPYRILQIKIKNETLTLVHQAPGTASVAKDFDSMQPLLTLTEASYLLFRIGGAKNWILILFATNKVKVNEKMLYAASKNTLKTKLGPQFFTEDLHISNTDELTYNSYVNSKQSPSALSEMEKLHLKVLKEEEMERESRMKANPVPAFSSSRPEQPAPPSAKIGGYHHVTIPLDSSAKEEVEKIVSGIINFVEFRINGKGDLVETVNAKSVTVADLPLSIVGSEPRFYVYTHQRSRGGSVSNSHVFIYCCPDASPPQLRMVYSTSKSTVAQQIAQLGITIAKKLEIRAGAELTEEYLVSELYASTLPSSPPSSSSTSPPASSPFGPRAAAYANKAKPPSPASPMTAKKTFVPHPLFSLVAEKDPKQNLRKKVVLPPPGAYC